MRGGEGRGCDREGGLTEDLGYKYRAIFFKWLTHDHSQYLWLHNILKPLVIHKNDSNVIPFLIHYTFFVLIASSAFKRSFTLRQGIEGQISWILDKKQ